MLELMMCAQAIDQFDQQLETEQVQIIEIETEETTEDVKMVEEYFYEEDEKETFEEETEGDDSDVEGYYYALNECQNCGFDKAWDCADDKGDFYECINCGFIEYYNEIPEHICTEWVEISFDCENDGTNHWSAWCSICGNGLDDSFITEERKEAYWELYTEVEEEDYEELEDE